MSILTPDIGSGERLGPVGKGADAPVASWTERFDSGSVVKRSVVVVPRVAGYYTIEGAVRQISTEQHANPADAGSSMRWALTTSTGGRLTSSFDPSGMPAGALAVPGPFRLQTPTVGVQLCDPSDPPPGGCGPQRSCCLVGTVTYKDAPGLYLPMGRASVQSRIVNPVTGATLLTQIAVASSSGGFGGFACPLPGEQSSITVLGSHSRFTVTDARGAGDPPLLVYPSSCGQALPYVLQSDAAAIFQRMLSVTDNQLALFGKSQPWIPVKIVSAALGAYDRNGPAGPEVRIPAGSIGALTDGTAYTNRFVPAHEMGHAFLDRAFQNNDEGYGQCPPIHPVGDTTNFRCAYSEGFADWHTLLTLPGTQGVFDFEDANYAAGFPGKGHLIEGAVASYLVETTDAVRAVESDALALSVSFVGQVIERCEHTRPRPGAGANDIRNFRFCLENRLTAGNMRFYPSAPSFQQPTWTLANMSNNYVWNVDGIH